MEERVPRELPGKLRDERLRQELSHSLEEAQNVIWLWQVTYDRVRPHSSLGSQLPAPVTFPDLTFCLPMAATTQQALARPGPEYQSGHHRHGVSSEMIVAIVRRSTQVWPRSFEGRRISYATARAAPYDPPRLIRRAVSGRAPWLGAT